MRCHYNETGGLFAAMDQYTLQLGWMIEERLFSTRDVSEHARGDYILKRKKNAKGRSRAWEQFQIV